MLSGEGNAGERLKTTIGLISKKATLHVQHTFFVHFFDFVLHDHNVNFQKLLSYTFYRGNVARFLVHFFSLPLILHWWPLAFLILLPLLLNFHVVLSTKKYLLCFFFFFISRPRSLPPFFSLSFAGLPLAFSFSRSFSCSISQICGHDN